MYVEILASGVNTDLSRDHLDSNLSDGVYCTLHSNDGYMHNNITHPIYKAEQPRFPIL